MEKTVFSEILEKIANLKAFYAKNSNYYIESTQTHNEIQLLFVNFCRFFMYQIRYYSFEDEQKFLGILSGFLSEYPKNALFINEILQRIDKNTLRVNRLQVLKGLLHFKKLEFSIWLLYLFKEISSVKNCDYELFLKRIGSIFTEICKEENGALENALSRLENTKGDRYSNEPENLLSNLTKIMKIYQEFSELLSPNENSRIGLYCLHRIPFCKVTKIIKYIHNFK